MSTLPDADQTLIWIRASARKKPMEGRMYKTLMAKTIFLYGIKDDGWPQFLFFEYIIYVVLEILWRPLVAGEEIERWMDGKHGKTDLKKDNFVISCYQVVIKVVISCYHVNSSKN